MFEGLPYDIHEAMVQCFGRCFYYKDKVAAFMRSSGVPRILVDKYRNEYKFVWAKKVLAELGETEDGRLVQRRILTELCRLRDVPDPNVADRDAALDALRDLKRLAVQHDLEVVGSKESVGGSSQGLARKQKLVAERAEKLRKLHGLFCDGLRDPNRQRAGYSLEDLLKELFAQFEIDFRKSYKTETEQIDGHLNFEGFDYLVEARWRSDLPTVQEIGGFKVKVDRKLESTRGLFVSIQGFRPEVVSAFEGSGCNIIFLNGEDLVYVLEGAIDLHDGLKFKIEKAAQEGRCFVPLRDFFKK
jgi:hypothetical protein